jgi:hypothetical protein
MTESNGQADQIRSVTEWGSPEPHPGETWRWPTECSTCGESVGPWSPDTPFSGMTHIRHGGAPWWSLNANHEPTP